MVFGILNIPAVQNYAKELIVQELKNKIGTELGIGRLHFQPFNTIELDSIYLYGKSNEQILIADKLSANIDILSLFKQKFVLTSAKLSDFDIHLSKDSVNAPLNIQYIIDAFKPENNEPSSKLAVKLSAVNINNGNFYYDIKDKPLKENIFDPNHIHISNFATRLSLKSLTADSLNIQIRKLSLKERSGLEIRNLSCRLLTQGNKATLKGFILNLPSSFIQFDNCEANLDSNPDANDMLDKISIDCVINPSYIAPKDISAFVPALKNFEEVLTIKTHISGSIDNIKVQDLTLDYGSKMHLSSNVEVKDLKDKEKTYILGSIDNLTVTTDGIKGLLNNFSKKETQLPNIVKNLGTITFQGDISGYLNALTAFGSFDTHLGIVKADILFGINKYRGLDSYFRGKIYTTDFELGNLLNEKDLNKTSLTINIDIQKPSYQKWKGKAEGIIYDFDYKDYRYKDITMSAAYDGTLIDGHLNINDPNGQADIDAVIDLADKNNPGIDITGLFKNIRFNELKLAEQYKSSSLTFSVNANLTGKDIDSAKGHIEIDSIDFIREDKEFMMNKLLIEASHDNNHKVLTISSDIVNGKIEGDYTYATLKDNILHTLHPYLPALIKNKTVDDRNKNAGQDNLSFNISVNNTESLSDVLKLPISVLSPAKIIGNYNSINNRLKIEAFAPSLKSGGMSIQSGYIMAETEDSMINAKIDLLAINQKGITNNINVNLTAANNEIHTNILFLNDGKQNAKGKFDITALFAKETDTSPLQVDIDVLPSELSLNNASWKVDKSHVMLFDQVISIDNFSIHNDNGDQEIKINGKYSKNDPKKILKTELKNINLEYIFQTLSIDVLKFGGDATGSLFLSSIEGKPYANTRLDVHEFKFNGTNLGNLNLFSELDEETNKVVLDGKITSDENKLTTVNGFIDPIEQELSLNFDADSINIGFLANYASSIFNKVEGRGSGNVHLFGNFSDVTVEGKAFINNGKVGISFLNTDYSFTDTIYMKSNLIYFNDVEFTDEFHNKAIGNGKVAHDYFHDFMYYVDLSADNFLLYNITEKQNPLFSGKVFASGKGSIGGDEKGVNIDISMRTEEKTAVRLNFMEDVINEYTFITYKDPQYKTDTLSSTDKPPGSNVIKTDSGMDINMNFYIDATPDAVVELVMDPVGGDVIRGSGSGALQFTWSTKSAPRLYGTYLINRGSYNFTFQRLVERKFAIQDGSNVQFKGDPFDATLDVNAVYKVTGNLNDLDQKLVKSTGQTNIPVHCLLNLTGPLKQPAVKLDVMFPNADPEVQRQIKSLMNTEDMINRQVTYLLLLSKFYTPDMNNVEHKTSDFAAVASATLSNQLSKIVSQIDDRWQLGTNIRTSDSEFTSTEVELMLSSQLLNDRLLINGNFGYKDDPQTQDAFIGDIDLELLLNSSGSWRIKAYNHYNEKYYYTGGKAVQTQGVGLMYKKDFDHIKDLFNFKRIQNIKSGNDSIKPARKDSTQKDSIFSHFVKIKK